jgi:phosphatidate cytidylyltransferase
MLLNKMMINKDYNIVLILLILIWTCDTAAYFGGRLIGKTRLTEISPGKTWEGAMIGIIFTAAASVAVYFLYKRSVTLSDMLVIGLIVGIFGQIGDIFESLIKRFNNVKDSSQIIPGHGGMLDRFDSLIFVTPVIYVYLSYLKFYMNI